MAQKLIIISGSPCVGKTTAAKVLYEQYHNSAYLDGDWCWCVHPFSLDDPRLREGDKAMSAVLSNYLRLGFDYVVFSTVVAMYENIRQGILRDITAQQYEVIGFTLTCTGETLRQRHKARGDQTQCSFEWLSLPPYPGDHVIHTDDLTPAEVAAKMKEIIDTPCLTLSAGPLILRAPGPEDLPEVARIWDMDQGPIPEDEARRVLARIEDNHRKNRPGSIYHLCLAVAKRENPGFLLGWCGLDGTNGHELHIFYSIVPEYRGRGFATQAVRALLDYAFTQAGVPFVNGGCYKDNLASARVMEKSGMRPAGTSECGDPLYYLDRDTYLRDCASNPSAYTRAAAICASTSPHEQELTE